MSLRGRLVATTVAAALVAVTVLVVGLQLLLAHQSSRESLSTLQERADAAATTVRFRGGRTRVLDTPANSLDQNIWIFDADGRRIDGTEPPRSLRGVVARLSASDAEHSVDVHGRVRVLARPVPHPGSGTTGAVVVAALDLAPYENAERRSLWLSLGLGLLAVVTAAAAAWAASGYALRQVRRMARRADDWREHDLTGRFDLGVPRDELTELADTLDRMLDRITQAILTERRLTDEVAHELRTPLTVIRSEAQLAQLDGATPGESLEAIVAATDRMTASIDTMLAVARSAHADESGCAMREVMTQLVAHGSARDDVEVVAEATAPEDLVAAPLRVVVAAAVPLLDNGVRHAASRVVLRVTGEGRRVLLHVVDDGEGVDPAHRQSIFEPGHSTATDGAGLGLALARRLAHSVGAEVSEQGAGHGHFVLSLPRG